MPGCCCCRCCNIVVGVGQQRSCCLFLVCRLALAAVDFVVASVVAVVGFVATLIPAGFPILSPGRHYRMLH